MRTNYLASGILVAAILSTVAMAQTNAPVSPPAGEMSKSNHWRSSKLIGVNIYNEKDEKLGDVNEIILDPAGKVLGYVIGVGGFLGMGEHDILVEPSKIKFVNEARRSSAATTNRATDTKAATPATGNPPREARAANERWYPDHGILNATKDQLKEMKEFKYSTYN